MEISFLKSSFLIIERFKKIIHVGRGFIFKIPVFLSGIEVFRGTL